MYFVSMAEEEEMCSVLLRCGGNEEEESGDWQDKQSIQQSLGLLLSESCGILAL